MGVDISWITYVDGDRQSYIVKLRCSQELCFPQFGPRGAGRLFRNGTVVGQLHDQELHIGLMRLSPPTLN